MVVMMCMDGDNHIVLAPGGLSVLKQKYAVAIKQENKRPFFILV
jgi:hypothetical protein